MMVTAIGWTGLAVVVTLFYLGYQFRQTATLERTAGQRELLSRCRDWVELTINAATGTSGASGCG